MNYDKWLNKLHKYGEDERSSFPYWASHWAAYNLVALKLHIWKLKYLFHDFEKPWMKLILRDYMKVRKWHKTHRKHHIFYGRIHGFENVDWEAAVIDWECSRYTKYAGLLTAREQTDKIVKNEDGKYTKYEVKIIKRYVYPILDKLCL